MLCTGLARFGCEEFAIVLPDTDSNGAWHVAQSIRTALGRKPVRTSTGAMTPLTLSAGIALTHATAGSAPADLMGAADKALYEAKRRGRDGIEMDRQQRAGEPLRE